MRTRLTITLGLIAAVFASGAAASMAAATPPVTLDSGYVTDEAGVLSADELEAANDRLSELAQADGGDLFVVFVDSFTDPSDSVTWTDDTAVENGLGAHQYLIAVAVDDRQYAISADANGPLDEGEVDRVIQAMETGLGAGDWDGAVLAAAEAFPGQASGAAGGLVWPIVLLVGAAAVILVIVLVVRSRRRKQTSQPAIPDPNDPYAAVGDEELAQQAGSALVHADDAITASRQELGFAIAQYGDDSTSGFTHVVEAAQTKVGEAFSLKQKIDDEIPDTVEQRRAWHIRIIALCDEADDLLNQNIEAFEELRKLEAEAPQALERIKARRATAAQAVSTSAPALADLARTYDTAALAPVADNAAQAQERLDLADSEIAAAAAAISAGSNGEAAFSIRTAEEAVEQSEHLVDAVTALGRNLAAVEDRARAMITDLEADIAAAGAVPDPEGRLAPLVARTRANVDAAAAGLQTAPRNPQQVLDALTATNADIDAALGQVRQAAEQAQRARRALEQRLAQAQAQIMTAGDFINTRRGAIGATARTRLAEANAAYSEAVAAQSSDPTFANERATRAYSLASEALSYARSEVDTFNTGGWSGGYGGGRGGDLGGAILGGIIGGLFSGGGGGGGGGSWSSGGGWRSGGSSRSSRPSSFGGGSRSSSRGGGRSRGGRF